MIIVRKTPPASEPFMGFHEHITALADHPVRDFYPDVKLTDTHKYVYRLSTFPRYRDPVFESFGCLGTLICLPLSVLAGVIWGLQWAFATFLTGTVAIWCLVVIARRIRTMLRKGLFCPYCDARLAAKDDQFCDSCDRDWKPVTTTTRPAIADRLEEHSALGKQLAAYLSDPIASKSIGLIITAHSSYEWEGNDRMLDYDEEREAEVYWEPLRLASQHLPNLQVLFIGEVTSNETEVSWTDHGDLTTIIESFPNLKHLWIRGGEYHFQPLKSDKLETVVLQSTGLSKLTLHNLFESHIPNLKHLEVWTGNDEYGDCTIKDLLPLFDERPFRKLTRLGICNCSFTDEVAEKISKTPWLSQLEVLDLSSGTLGPEGANYLLKTHWLRELSLLDIHHHFLNAEMVRRLQTTGVMVNAEDPQLEQLRQANADISDRYCAVFE